MTKPNPGALRARSYTKRRQEQGDIKTTVWLKGSTNAALQVLAKEEGITRDELIERLCRAHVATKGRLLEQN